jgi:hypothetical protein
MEYNIGNNRQISVKESQVTIEELESQKTIVLNANSWSRLVQLLPHIATGVDCLLAKQFVDFRQHIGGACFVSVFTGYNCVNIRQHYFHPIHGIRPCKYPGIALRLDEFNRLKELIPTINQDFPELAAAQPCTHKTFDELMLCDICQPFRDAETISACPYLF